MLFEIVNNFKKTRIETQNPNTQKIKKNKDVLMTEIFFRPNFTTQICCEECNEVISFHMVKCPVCHSEYAGTSYSGSPQDCIDDKIEKGVFECFECKSKFLLLYWNPLCQPESLVKLLE